MGDRMPIQEIAHPALAVPHQEAAEVVPQRHGPHRDDVVRPVAGAGADERRPVGDAAVLQARDEVMRILRAGVEISRSRPPHVIGAMMEEHDAIVDAIRAHDADGAALAMRWHLSQGRKRLMP